MCVVTSVLAAVLVIVYRYVCLWDNRKRDESGIAEGFGNAYQDDLTDKTVSWCQRKIQAWSNSLEPRV